jgi:hypothetical protein
LLGQNPFVSSAHQPNSSWAARIADFPPTSLLPSNYPRPHEQTFHGDSVDIELDEDFYEALDNYSRVHGHTLFASMFSAFALLVNHYNLQPKLLIGTAFYNRNSEAENGIIGMLVNNVVMPVVVDKNQTIKQFVQSNQDNHFRRSRTSGHSF